MKILFIYSVDDISSPEKPLRNFEQMQFGISYISSLLKKYGHSTKLLVLSRFLGRRNNTKLDRSINRFRPELICFTSVSTEYPFIVSLARYIKRRYPYIYLFIGGPHVTLCPEGVLEESFDALCIGEGEFPTLELVSFLERRIEPSGILNLWIKHSRTYIIEKNPTREFIANLDNIPFPDWEMWVDWVDPEEEDNSRFPVLLGRGCPFECTYCCNHALKKIAIGSYVRFRTPENIVQELKEIAVKFPTKKNIYFEVETIGADKDWVFDLCSKLKEFNTNLKKPFSFSVNLRIAPGIDFHSMFKALKESNFKAINIGVESGSERVRREILNRFYSNKDIIEVADLARDNNLKVHFYNLVGIPGESEQDFEDTLRINSICQPDLAYLHVFFPYPGTKLYEHCKERGFLNRPLKTHLERCEAILDLPEFRRRRIQSHFVWFDYNIYKGCKPMLKILPKVFVSKCRSNSFLYYLYRRLTFSKCFKLIKSLIKKKLIKSV